MYPPGVIAGTASSCIREAADPRSSGGIGYRFIWQQGQQLAQRARFPTQ
jgi:hypothetical protein